MEVIFKNKPTPNMEINSVEDGQSLEVIYDPNPKSIPSKLYLAKSSAIEISNAIRKYLARIDLIQFNNGVDIVRIYGGGQDYDPKLCVEVEHRINSSSDKWIVYFSRPDAEILAKALERWAKHPEL